MPENRKELTVAGTLLLVLSFTIVFLVPLFPAAYHPRIYDILFTLIVLNSAFALQRNRKTVLALALGVTIAEWSTSHTGLALATVVARGALILFFVWVVISLIIQIASRRQVTAVVIINSICGYLLMGIVFTLMVGLLLRYQPSAFNLPPPPGSGGSEGSHLTDYLYYTFVTFATLGYGDILPKTACAKSLATLIAVVGQLYLATIIAMLVGKYVATATVEHSQSKE
jgi:voltage-gated potassium channel